MKKPGRPPEQPAKKSGRQLSDSDERLWQHTAATLKPLKRGRPRVHAALENRLVEPSLPRPSAPSAKPKPLLAAVRPEPIQPRASPPLSGFDPKRARRLRSGQVEVDARIDLHGMRQSEAHTALRRFLHASHVKGHRVVLVITGKGAPAGQRETPWTEAMNRGERGVLRRSVPMWLAEPDLRAIVVSFTEAAIRHGGEGALYVHLRRKP